MSESRLEDESQVSADVFCGAYKLIREMYSYRSRIESFVSVNEVTLEPPDGSHNFTSLLPIEWDQ
jgi:hypothetical protein